MVALVSVARQQRGGVGIGARDDEGRHAQHVRGQPRGEQRPDELARGDEHLAAEMAALLLRRELVLEVDGRRARFDHPLHQLERVQRPAEAGLRVGDDRKQVVDAAVALGPLDPVGAQERIVQPAHHRGDAVRRIEALIRIDVGGKVPVRRDLPAGEIDRLQAGLGHLHRLAAGERAERRDVLLLGQQPPELLGAVAGERMLDGKGSAQPNHVLGRVVPRDPVPPSSLRPLEVEALDRRKAFWTGAVSVACAHLMSFRIRNCHSRILDGILSACQTLFRSVSDPSCWARIRSSRAPEESTCSRASARAPLGLPAARASRSARCCRSFAP